jgi:hypothetical protein
MNAEITITKRAFLELYEAKRAHLAGKPRPYLTDLLDEADDLRQAVDFSTRAGAEICRAACTSLLEESPTGN